MRARYVYLVTGILALIAAFACWCRAPLIWDGAYQFNASLIMQRPYHYLTRFHSFLLWWPTVWASNHTTNVMLLQTIYGLPFLLAPIVAVLGSWWIVKNDAPHLIIWPIFGVAAGSLPGQIFIINDSIFQLHLFWPIFMSIFVPPWTSGKTALAKGGGIRPERIDGAGGWDVLAAINAVAKMIFVAVLIVFQFVHQVGAVLFLGAAAAAVLVAIAEGEKRDRALLHARYMLALAALAVTKIIATNYIEAFRDTYAEQQATWHEALNMWGSGVQGWPIRGLVCMWGSALLVFVYRKRQSRQDGRSQGPALLAVGIFALAAAGLACWTFWAGHEHLWWKALDYRRWVAPLTAPFFLLATLDACTDAGRSTLGIAAPRLRSVQAPEERSTQAPAEGGLRGALAIVLGITFATVMGLQCETWREQTNRLFAEVMASPGNIVPESAVPWTKETALDHWGSRDLIVLLQGKTPAKLLLDTRSIEAIEASPPKIPHWDVYPDPPNPGPSGWYDMRPLLRRLAQHPNGIGKGGEHRYDENTTPP